MVVCADVIQMCIGDSDIRPNVDIINLPSAAAAAAF